MTDEMQDRLAVRDLVEDWALYRDSGMWERFRAVWHDDGRMMATWTQGGPDMFIEMSKKVFESDVSIIHALLGTTIDLAGDRAIAMTKMTISQRAPVHDVWCDVVCTGRFYDFIERRDGKWGFVLRQPIYEKDRLDPIDPSAKLELDPEILNMFPVGYRHLAYLQHGLGYDIKKDMPGLRGPEVEQLYKDGAAWLEGKPLNR
jgi:hypothetical protein